VFSARLSSRRAVCGGPQNACVCRVDKTSHAVDLRGIIASDGSMNRRHESQMITEDIGIGLQ